MACDVNASEYQAFAQHVLMQSLCIFTSTQNSTIACTRAAVSGTYRIPPIEIKAAPNAIDISHCSSLNCMLVCFSVDAGNVPAIAGGTVGGLIAVLLVVIIIIVVAVVIIKQKNVKKG